MLPSFVSSRKWLFPGSAFLAVLLLGPATFAYGQGNPIDNRYISLSPASPISTEPFTLTENSPNVPNGTTVSINLRTFDPSHPLQSTATAGLCTLVQTNGAASCQLGRIPPGTYRLYVQAGVNGNYNYINVQLDFSVSAPGANAATAFQGQYAFLVTNPSVGNSTVPSGSAATGSFTADGHGNITAGTMDLNSTGDTFANLPVTGKYQLDATGKGSVTLTTSQGIVSFVMFVPSPQTLSNVALATLVSSPGGLVTGSGQLVNQSGTIQSSIPVNPGFGSTLNGAYQFKLTGETNPVPYSVAGAGQFKFTASGDITSAGKLTISGIPVDFTGLQGTYAPVDGTTGRTTMTFSGPGQPSITYAVYETSEQNFYFLSLAPHATNALIAGTSSLSQ